MSFGRRLLVIVLVGCSAWGAWLSFALLKGRLPDAWAQRSLRPVGTAVPAAANGACDCGPSAMPAHACAQTVAPAAAPALGLERYAVCGREEAPPALAELSGLSPRGLRLAVHCGGSLHVIALGDGGAWVPQRIAQLNASSASPAEALRAVTPLAADLNADGRRDLLAPVLLVDSQGNPRGGALHVLRGRLEGGFEPAQRALELAPGALASARLRAEGGEDLALIQLGAAQLARTNELWIVRSGAAPLRSAARSAAGLGAPALAVADLDRDGLDEIAVGSESEGKVRLFRGTAAADANAEPIVWDVPGMREALSVDLDGDGARDLLLLGTRLWLVLASKGELQAPRELLASDGLRELHALDLDRDGRLDLVGYAHPSLVALLQTAPLAFERRTFATLAGDAAVFSARLLAAEAPNTVAAPALRGGAAPDGPTAWITMLSNGSEPAVEVAFARDLGFGARIALGTRVQPLPDAPLVERFVLR